MSPGVSEGFLEDLKEVVSHHRGDHELLLAVGERRLLLGDDFRVSAERRLPGRAGGPDGRLRAWSPERPEPLYTVPGASRFTHAHAPELHECRQCCAFCDRVVHPSGCIESGCQFLYLYDDEETGRRFMGCMNKVFRGEIDAEMFDQAERTRHGFGGVKMSGLAAAAVPRLRRARLRRLQRGLRLREPGLLRACRTPDEFDLRDRL